MKGNKYEFFMYRIVYLSLNSEKFELNSFLKEMKNEELTNEYVQMGINFKSILMSGNIKRVFLMYKTCKIDL